MTNEISVDEVKILSPRRNTTEASSIHELAMEQLAHFGIDPASPFGEHLSNITQKLYAAQYDLNKLWEISIDTIGSLDQSDRIAYFNAKKFLSFQIAKLLDTLQNPSRKSYQSLGYSPLTTSSKGTYPIFDNVTAIFSATPVIARTATYIYACSEWIEDAFKGKELMLEIYSRLLNPTSVALANHVVDMEAGPYTAEYFAWNFNSGMAAIDGILSHVLGRNDIIITSRYIYGGTHQLLNDWYAKSSNLGVAVESFDGYGGDAFLKCYEKVQNQYADRLADGRKVYLYLESPCNPHGYVLDIPQLCKEAHQRGIRVMLDATVGTPFLTTPLQRKDVEERPDFVIHSYTKDMSGTGSLIAGCVIGKNEDMFIPKGETVNGVSWNDTLFWNVYYVKGAFLNADVAYDVLMGMKTLNMRMMTKCINTTILAKFFDSHPQIKVHCNSLDSDENSSLREKLLFIGLPAPLFTIEIHDVPLDEFKRFFDCLSPTFAHMISLGQSNTIVNCPALTTHSELTEDDLRKAGLTPTTMRIAVGDEDPKDLIRHFVHASRLVFDRAGGDFASGFMDSKAADQLVEDCYLGVHEKYIRDAEPLKLD